MKTIFISHVWRYDEHYKKVVEWFDNEPYFKWANYSVPEEKSCGEGYIPNYKLKNCLTNQINPSQYIVILSGLYVSYSDWIEYEINEAHRMEKFIIGVKPWGNERLPQIVQDKANIIVGWNKNSIINAIKS